MSLGDDLDKIREKGSANDKIRVAYESMVGQLGHAEAAGRALKIGDTMPSFLLPNAEGRLVFSDDLLRQGPLVVDFFRGNWCPYCRRTLEALETALPAIEGAGGHLVALTPDTGSHFDETKERHGNSGWFIPIPATFVVDQSGLIRYAFVNVDFTRRAEPEEVVDVLRALSGRQNACG